MRATLVPILLLYTYNSHAWCPLVHQRAPRRRIESQGARPVSQLDARRRPQSIDYEYDDDDNDSYWQKEEERPKPFDVEVDMDAFQDDDEQDDDSQGNYYKVYFDGQHNEEELALDWEECSDGTMVLLPPPFVSKPKAIIHFVGGTFFGSTPKLWYRTLLEGLVRTTQCVVVATPIPIVLLKNPLQHVKISRKLQRQFRKAYVNVVEDEYGVDSLEGVPIVGIGHSLGARLLTVLATLNEDKNSRYNSVPPYQSYILMSFTNYGASASIPGIQSLLNQSKQLEERDDDDDYDTDSYSRQRNRHRVYDDDYDEEWDELMQDFTSTFREQATRVKTALTPASNQLEFHPSPDQLWKALKDDYRYTIPKTLVIQFEQDTIDQSPRLTDCLLESTDIKYARLKGVHLTPVSATSDENDKQMWGNGGLLDLSSKATKALWKLVRGKQSPHTSDELRDLRRSIARYITDVVAAPPNQHAESVGAAGVKEATQEQSVASSSKDKDIE